MSDDWMPFRRMQVFVPAVDVSPEMRALRQWRIGGAAPFQLICTEAEADVVDEMLKTLGAQVLESSRAAVRDLAEVARLADAVFAKRKITLEGQWDAADNAAITAYFKGKTALDRHASTIQACRENQ